MTPHTNSVHQPVAIIGMGGMFAKSRNLKEYWRTLRNGIDCISDPPATHRQLNDYFDTDPKKADHIYCNRGGFLPSVPFDPTEFGIPPASLEATDTSQLLGLVAAKMALTDAGYGDDREFDRERTSVILGVTGTQELVISLGSRLGHPLWRKALDNKGLSVQQKSSIIEDISGSYVPWQESSFPGLLGNVVAGRICNRLNLGGTNCVVDAACASSLGAIHLGLMELVAGKSNMVVTGGVDTINDIFMHMCFSKTGVLSHTGDARPFSSDADGTVLGEGIGILVLKRLEDAERDADRIYAVIRGIGSSSDGKSQSIYAPRPDGQARALIEAYRNAGISPETVGLVEAHGTGTRVGDEMEFTALKKVFGAINPNGNHCALGSVKSMIGHTKAAAGAAGLIKSALSLYNKVLPPTLKAGKPDPKLGIESSPFYLNTAPRPWFTTKGNPRRGGVSSFGFGGSNFHVVLEEYQPDKKEIAWDGSVEILAFSGPDTAAIANGLLQVQEGLGDDFDTAALSRTARSLRTAFSSDHRHRLILVVNTAFDGHDLKERLQQAVAVVTEGKPAVMAAQGIYYDPAPQTAGKIAFMFPGQGSQYPHMGRDLVCCFPGAMEAVQAADHRFDQEPPLWEILFPRPAISEDQRQRQTDDLRRTDVAQPAIGAVSLAMLSALGYFNVRPDVTCGHSYGELTALHAAGWISQETLLRLSVTRGRLMADAGKNVDAGTMLAVNAPIDRLQALADQIADVVLANLNSPDQGVLSGTTEAIEQAKARCAEKGYRTISLPVSAAFHSPLVEGAQKPFCIAAEKATFTPTRIPVYANVTAAPYPADASQCADMLGRQLTSTVRFQETVEHLYESGVHTFVEVGPKTVLSGLVRATLKERNVTVIALDRSSGKASGIMDLAHAIGHLAALGVDLDLNRWETEAPAVRPQKMTIPLSGTNYRAPRKTNSTPKTDHSGTTPPPQAQSGPATSLTRTVVNTPTPMDTRKPMHAAVATSPIENQKIEDRKLNQTVTANMNGALAIVQKGLESIQSLQQQTAQAHQKFLDTQAQASRTLQEMIKSTRMFMGSALETAMPAAADNHTAVVHPEPNPPRPPAMGDRSWSAATIAAAVEPAVMPKTTDSADSLSFKHPSTTASQHAKPTIAAEAISRALIDIVSELTGYPADMLGLEMDIEADLGIDSIKRVEILSAMEERMPHLPQVTPDMVGTLKTLGQIRDFLTAEIDPDMAACCQPSQAAHSADSAAPAVENTLITIVSELTGYPADMLGLEMDIEADLGIDSIKRVEILSAMEERMPHLPQVTPDMVGTLKTLGQICAYLFSAGDDEPAIENGASSPVQSVSAHREPSETIPRHIIDVVESPKKPGRPLRIESGRWIGVLSDNSPMAQSMVSELANMNIETRLLAADAADNAASFAGMAGLILCGSTDPETAFLAAKHAAPELFSASVHGDALFAATTGMDGAFGFTGSAFDHPEQGALAGLVKTAALEWDAVVCRAIDLSPDFADPDAAAQQVVAELLDVFDHDPVEIGLRPDGRVTLKPIPAQVAEGPILLEKKDVIVVTGGARGVAADCALYLARATGVSIALIGRSAPPFKAPDWLAGVQDEAAMKKAILENAFTASKPTPQTLEAAYRKHAGNLSIARTIDALAASGVNAGYFCADVTDRRRLHKAVDAIEHQLGPITGLVHGAGVLHDRLIVDKTVEQFRQVYATKVDGLKNLLSATQSNDLRHLVLFSSVSARTGNIGQCDYAMANEALNKMARVQALNRPACRVAAINWGPWDGGMVTPALKKAFDAKNIQLIPVDTGARLMAAEMNNADPGPVEVLIGSMLASKTDDESAEFPDAPMALLERRELDLQRYPVLASHIIGGRPVVPFALITEWIGHGALKENPGYSLHGIDDLRLLSGIRIEQEKKLVRLMAGKARKTGDAMQVDVELRNGVKNGKDVIHTRARALLVDRFPAAPIFTGNGKNGSRAYPRDLDAIYGPILFHGDHLRAIKAIDDYSDHGMTARLTGAPKPEAWMQDPIQGCWMADPMVLDGAFQMAIVWCFEQSGKVCLPSYARAYRQYRPAFPATGVTAVMAVTAAGHRKMMADFTFLDDDGQVVATLNGYEATVDESLIHALKENVLKSVLKAHIQ